MTEKHSKLRKYILATVAYYDGFSYPLTAFEVWRYLIRTDYSSDSERVEIELADTISALQSDVFSKFLENFSGFYFLKGRREIVDFRIKNQKISAGKLRRLRRVVFWLRFIPFVRMVGATGGLAMKNAHWKSDWDLLIVTAAGHIWTGRTLVTLFSQIIGKRRYDQKIVNRLCLNYFLTEQSLEVITKDLFSANEYMFMIPLFGGDVYHRFQIKNQWIKNIKPTYNLQELPHLKIITDNIFSKTFRNIGEFVLGGVWLEKGLRNIEKRKILENPKTHQEGSLVYAENDALVFLPVPHGPVIFERFKEKIEDFGLSS
ncbi:MAG: hypothetical protein WCF93_01750 [Candidatus Moraniibacteriota bacterium]